eukprot:CAMPEP_0172665666 /NCGR_PEP_ID=MMETSP1074-20121228/7387_1 /TAXON_ID=2916 /ORGANISM="Ceratium fusus, Strain PA161109" /LENGTH=54 /DNA_ID=CAMNT_0013482007 /DNA_START=92 /DNA_END=253 /DNA_ORIENTATION=-
MPILGFAALLLSTSVSCPSNGSWALARVLWLATVYGALTRANITAWIQNDIAAK